MSNAASWLMPYRPNRAAGLLTRRDTPDMGALANKYAVTSMVGAGMHIVGPVTVRDSLMVFGEISGDVKVTGQGRILLLREGSRVDGAIEAEWVGVAGTVNGDISARFIRLYPSAIVRGTLRAEKLVVEEGASLYNPAMQVGHIEAQAQSVTELRPIAPRSA